MNPEGTVHVVVIYQDSRDTDGRFRIAPSTLIVHAGDTVKFRDVSGSDNGVKFRFPQGKPFTSEPAIGSEHEVSGEPKAYPYKALCGPKEMEAEGSKPIIIIYDR